MQKENIKFKFEGRIDTLEIPSSFENCITSFKKHFSIDEEKMRKLTLTYKDDDKVDVSLTNEEDFENFLNTENIKMIEGKIEDKENYSMISTGNSIIKEKSNKDSNENFIESINYTQINKIIDKNIINNNIKDDELDKENGDLNDKEILYSKNEDNNEKNKDIQIEESIVLDKSKEVIPESVIKSEEQNNKNNDEIKEKNNNDNIPNNINNNNNDIINEKNKKDNITNNKINNNINNNNNTINQNNTNSNINNNNSCNISWLLVISMLVNLIAILFYGFTRFSENKKTKLIIGIDFGSTFSGFSIIYNSDINFDDSNTNQIFSSELIMDKETEIGLRIGSKAHYFPKNRIVPENKLYFSKFKKHLDPKNNNNFAESNIPEGEKVDLENVIKGYLVLLREEIQSNNNKIKEMNINDIKWILSVPPLWDDKGKNFMKRVAIKAGMINSEIALEPEVASLSIFHDKNIKKKFLQKGKTFLIVDAGGYTVDISANKIIDNNNNLEQLLKPTSDTFGSNLINEKIIEILGVVYGKEKIEDIKNKEYDSWEKTLDEIEEKKKQINDNTAENIRINIQFSKMKSCGYMSDNCDIIYNGTKIYYSSKYVDIPPQIIIDIISQLAFNIVNLINKSFSKTNENIDLIVLTGGFSNCKIFEKKIRDNFRGSLKELVFLNSPQETVMKGAAIFGLRPNQILYRISPVTIGVDNYEFINENDECEKLYKNDDGDIQCLRYKKFIERGNSIKTNEILKYIIYPLNDEISIFYSYDEELNENDKNLLETIEIPPSELPLKNRTITVSMKFSNYINITVMDEESYKSNWKIIYYPS